MDIVGDLVQSNAIFELKCQEYGPASTSLCPHLKAMSLCAHWCSVAAGL